MVVIATDPVIPNTLLNKFLLKYEFPIDLLPLVYQRTYGADVFYAQDFSYERCRGKKHEPYLRDSK
jgi:hypothetical protein